MRINLWILYFVLGTSLFFFPRYKDGIIFDSTAVIYYLRQFKSFSSFLEINWNKIWYENKTVANERPLQTKVYRPVQVITAAAKGLEYLYGNKYLPLIINALLVVISGLFLFLLILQLTRDKWASLGASFLFLFSTSNITGAWVFISGEHNLVVICVCLILLSYLKFKSKRNWFWLLPIYVVGFFGILYKEYVIFPLFVIYGAEILNRKRDLKLLAALLPLLFHCFFPSFYINSIFYQNPRLYSVSPSNQFFIRWEAMNHFVFQIPPLISLLGMWAMFHNNPFLKSKKKLCVFILICWCALFAKSSFPGSILPTIFASAVSLSAFWIHPILAIWSAIGWAPYLLVFYGVEVHMMYAIAPFAAILLWHIHQYLKKGTKNTQKVFYVLLVVAFADQLLNIIAVDRTFSEYSRMANVLSNKIASESTAKKNVLVSSTLMAVDIAYRLEEQHKIILDQLLYTFDAVIGSGNAACYIELNKFRALLDSFSKEKISPLFIDVDLGKNISHFKRFTKQLPYTFTEIEKFESRVTYPYLDPLKALIYNSHLSFMGSPDLIHFYTIQTKPFYRVMDNPITLYRLSDISR
jgi:hypothetical protein